jgi:glutaminyl-tRNA synthetase
LIKKGKAYVCTLSNDEWEEYKGNLQTPGKDSPGRSRSVEENLDLFARMKAGEFEDGAMVLRARIDMASPNINMRDPVIYRIRRIHHFRHGDKYCIHPMYDFAHPLEDAFEGITHSLCTLEFEIHRPLYDWVLENLDFPNPPHQYEFSRLNLTYTVMSKRKLLQLVKEKHVRDE